jgi:hypothetical protein
MKLPKTYRGLLSLLIQIAEQGNDYEGRGKMTEDDELAVIDQDTGERLDQDKNIDE